MRILRALAFVAPTIILCSCAYNDHFDNRTARYDIAAEQTRDQMILTNIVRASHAEPMSFMQLGQISGSNTSSATFGLPSLTLGPLSPTAATAALQKETIFGASAAGGQGFVGNQTSTSGTTSFQATPAETKDFYAGLLTPVQPVTVQFFVEQGVSRELLFYLFTSLVIENGRQIHNDPLSPEFQEFQKVVMAAIQYGLSAEPIPGTGRKSEDKAKGKAGPGKEANQVETQLCFDRSSMAPGLSPSLVSPICGTSEVSKDPRTVMYKGVKVTVVPRSVFGIFQYLGRIVAAGDRGHIKLVSKEAIDQGPFQDDTLFTVQTNPTGACFLSVDYEGIGYCIPLEGAENTKRILSMITQLLALNTAIQDIPVTPLVQSLQ